MLAETTKRQSQPQVGLSVPSQHAARGCGHKGPSSANSGLTRAYLNIAPNQTFVTLADQQTSLRKSGSSSDYLVPQTMRLAFSLLTIKLEVFGGRTGRTSLPGCRRSSPVHSPFRQMRATLCDAVHGFTPLGTDQKQHSLPQQAPLGGERRLLRVL